MGSGPFQKVPRACPSCGGDDLLCDGAAGEYDLGCQLAECGWAGLVDTVSEPGVPFQASYHLDIERCNRGRRGRPVFCPMCTRADIAIAEPGGPGSGEHVVTCTTPLCGWRGVITTL